MATLDAMEVTALKPGDVFYLDLRHQGWFRNADRNTWLRDRSCMREVIQLFMASKIFSYVLIHINTHLYP